MDSTDYRYVLLSSSRLDKFKEITPDLFNFRCPYCGDSKKNSHKTRGYIFTIEGNTRYKCHNCGASTNFPTFLSDLDASIYADYRVEKFGEKTHKRKLKRSLDKKFQTITENTLVTFNNRFKGLTQLSKLDSEDPVLTYCKSRKIPERYFDYLYSTTDVSNLTTKEACENIDLKNTPHLVIPFFKDEHKNYDFFQVRSIRGKLYMHLPSKHTNTREKLWGMPHIKDSERVFVFEGAIDAMMVNNAIAIGGVMNDANLQIVLDKFSDVVIAYDSDYRHNAAILKQVKKSIDRGHQVLLFDKTFVWKDVNDCIVKGGWSFEKLNTYMSGRVFSGLRALLELSLIKRK